MLKQVVATLVESDGYNGISNVWVIQIAYGYYEGTSELVLYISLSRCTIERHLVI